MGWVGCIFDLAMSKASWYDLLLSSVAAVGKYNIRIEWAVAVG